MWTGKKRNGGHNNVTDAVARMISAVILRLQGRLAGTLQRWERRYTAGRKRVALLLFCALFGGYCIYLLARATVARPAPPAGIELNKGSPAKSSLLQKRPPDY